MSRGAIESQWFTTSLQILLRAAITTISLAFPLSAQVIPSNIVPDTSLGAESSQVSSGDQVEQITGGAERGQNLFHSFREFNVGAGRGAYFLVPNDSIQNVLARVTGRNPSEILGTLGTFRLNNGQVQRSPASLFLINPNGIIFGESASLDLGGSFFATTANAIKLGESGLFSTSEPASDNLLTVSPSAFLFNTIAAQPIINRSQARRNIFNIPTFGLFVRNEQSLVLAGGDINLEGGQLYAPGGHIDLVSIQGTGTVQLVENNNRVVSEISDTTPRGEISLSNAAEVFVRSSRGQGSINIHAKNFRFSEESILFSGIIENAGFVETKAGDITINATDTVLLTGNSYISSAIEKGAIGQAGDINIKAQVLEMSDRAQISNAISGEGKAGNIIIQANQSISLQDDLQRFNQPTIGTIILNRIEPGGVGEAGDIRIRTPFLSLLDGAQISASTFGQGNAGVVDLEISNALVLNSGQIFSAVGSGGKGNGGAINIRTGSFSLLSGSQLLTIVRGSNGELPPGNGSAGNIRIEARDQVLISGISPQPISGRLFGSIIASAIDTKATGQAGNIDIQTGTLSITDLGQIRATLDNGASGQAGNIQINAKNVLATRGGIITTLTGGQGNAGNILIQVQEKATFDGTAAEFTGIFTGVSDSAGTGGDLTIKAGSLSIKKGAILSTQTFGRGNAGNLSIEAKQLRIESGGGISTTTDNLGNAGNIIIQAPESVQVLGEGDTGYIEASTDGVGNSGNLTITTGRLSLRDGGSISTGTLEGSEGQGGSLTVIASDAVEVIGTTQDSQSASKLGTVTEGNGNSGNLRIDTKRLIVREGGSVSTETQGSGRGGDLTVNASESIEVSGAAPNDNFVSAVTSETEQSGNAGNLDINTRRLLVKDGAYISAEARDLSTGTPGNVTINATDSIDIVGQSRNGSGSRISASIQSDFQRILTEESFIPDTRVSGTIKLTTQQLRLTNGGEVTTIAQGFSRAGDIILNVGELLEMQDGSILSAAFFTSGGNIQIAANQVLLRGASEIGTQVLLGEIGRDLGLPLGAGGNINIDAESFIALGDSNIFTFNLGGKGGNITFNTRAVFAQNYRPSDATDDVLSLKNNGRVDINASGAVSGVITLPDTTFIQNSLSQLPSNGIDTNPLLTNSCIARNQQNGTFYIIGREGLPTNPGELSTYATGTVQPTAWKRGDPIVEPQGVYQLPNGQLLMSRECE